MERLVMSHLVALAYAGKPRKQGPLAGLHPSVTEDNSTGRPGPEQT